MVNGRIRYLGIIVLCVMVLVGIFFGGDKKVISFDPDKNSLMNKGTLTICTSLYPVHIMALNITDNIPDIRLVNLNSPQSGCLHNTQLSVADMKTLENSDILIINGAGLEGYLEEALERFPDLMIVDASKGIKFDDYTGSNTNPDWYVEHHDEGLGEEHQETNPHTWVSISLAIRQVENIGNQLAACDPENKELYLDNTRSYINKLEDLKSRMHRELSHLKSRDIITLHNAFPYFAEEFSLNLLAVIQMEPDSEPSARELAETIDLVREHQVRAIFAEPELSDLAAQAIARETGAQVYTLDPASSGPIHPDAYLDTMDRNLQVLIEALK